MSLSATRTSKVIAMRVIECKLPTDCRDSLRNDAVTCWKSAQGLEDFLLEPETKEHLNTTDAAAVAALDGVCMCETRFIMGTEGMAQAGCSGVLYSNFFPECITGPSGCSGDYVGGKGAFLAFFSIEIVTAVVLSIYGTRVARFQWIKASKKKTNDGNINWTPALVSSLCAVGAAYFNILWSLGYPLAYATHSMHTADILLYTLGMPFGAAFLIGCMLVLSLSWIEIAMNAVTMTIGKGALNKRKRVYRRFVIGSSSQFHCC